jgi:dTDP-4-dehydrorhamnose reductase
MGRTSNLVYLVTGAKGQLGQTVVALLQRQGKQVCAFSRDQLDIGDYGKLSEIFAEYQPNVVLNCAAYTQVDRAESESEIAHRVNAQAPEHLAKLCAQYDAFLCHFSTDYVFDGKACLPYDEHVVPSPLGVYGQTKRLGEITIETSKARYGILRTAWVYGIAGKNFVKTILRLAQEREILRIVEDQIGTPTWTGDLAEVALALAEGQTESGIYHVTNSGVASWYDFALAICEEATALGWDLRVNQIIPISTAEYPTPAQRPSYSVLSRHKVEGILGRKMTHWRVALRQMLKALWECEH